jgi:hypothetical protein
MFPPKQSFEEDDCLRLTKGEKRSRLNEIDSFLLLYASVLISLLYTPLLSSKSLILQSFLLAPMLLMRENRIKFSVLANDT